MLPELSTIALRRHRLGLTQLQLAAAAGVSQSFIAKVEGGTLEPSYSRANALFRALEEMERKGEQRAADIMARRVISVKPNDRLERTVKLMRRHSISQLPVVSGKGQVGSITESGIVARMDSLERGGKVSQAMDEPFPQVPASMPVSAVTALLKEAPAVLVVEGKRVAGIITKADLLKTV